ncbi:MAG TPA: hypothetical protein VHZ95_15890 [Polyangiales bacterium]|nr:hypothetical protein [Polyangiales bacterium]
MSGEGVVGVIAAMPEEIAPLRRSLAGSRRVHDRPEIVTGSLAGVPIALCISGDGARQARDGALALLSTANVARLIVIGVAGALSPELQLFELVVATRVVSERGDSLQPSAAAVERALGLLGARAAVAISSEAIADSASTKVRLRIASGAGAVAAVVDLESASYARVAEDAGIPWLVVRAVSDTATEELPLLLNRSRDVGGAVRRGRVLREILTDPRTLPTLLRLRTRVSRCSIGLARAVRALSAGERTTSVGTADLGALHSTRT